MAAGCTKLTTTSHPRQSSPCLEQAVPIEPAGSIKPLTYATLLHLPRHSKHSIASLTISSDPASKKKTHKGGNWELCT